MYPVCLTSRAAFCHLQPKDLRHTCKEGRPSLCSPGQQGCAASGHCLAQAALAATRLEILQRVDNRGDLRSGGCPNTAGSVTA